METMWLPAASDCSITAVVEDPDEKLRAYFAFSSDAIAFSKLSRFGFAERVYS